MRHLARVSTAYTLIALVSSLVNLGCQAAAVTLYRGPWSVPLSVLLGTAAGLPIKYALEKRLVFGFHAANLRHDARLFALYTFFGVFTTFVFWATEWAFHLAFGTEAMRYAGAALGLAVGFALRYQIDKRYVFVPWAAGAAA